MESLDDKYGYDESIFISEVPDHLYCMICTLVLRDPIQILTCGHKICEVCFDRVKNHSTTNNTELQCPVDRQVVDLTDVREDVYFRRAVGNLVVRCYGRERGCEWQGDLRELHNHTEQCPFKALNRDVGIEISGTVKQLSNRVSECESSLRSKDKEIALLKDQLNEQQQMKEEVQSLKQQMHLLEQLVQNMLQNLDVEHRRQDEKQHRQQQQQQDVADLKSQNEALEHQMMELSQKNAKLEERLQQQQQHHQREIDDLKGTLNDQQSKKCEMICGEEMLQKGSNITLTSQDSASGGQSGANPIQQPAVVLKKIIMELHNGDPNYVFFSKDTHHSVQFTEHATVSARMAVAPPGSKVWFEVKCTRGVERSESGLQVGWATSDLPTSKKQKWVGEEVHGYAFGPFHGCVFHNGSFWNWGKGLTDYAGVVGVALDLVKGELLFSVDGDWTSPMGLAFSGVPADIKLFPAISGYRATVRYNFGDRGFTFGPPDPTFIKLSDVVQ